MKKEKEEGEKDEHKRVDIVLPLYQEPSDTLASYICSLSRAALSLA